MKYTQMLSQIQNALNKKLEKNLDFCLNSKMSSAIELWAALYEDKPPWLSRKKGIESAGLPGAIAAEVARLVTLELQSNATDSQVDGIYQTVVEGLRVQVESACALGGMVMKPFPIDGSVQVQFIRADRFFPIRFDSSGRIAMAAFVEQQRTGKNIFTRLEVHSVENETLFIRNFAYQSHNEGILGSEIPLSDVDAWADIEPDTRFLGVKKLPIGYFKIPLANTVDPDSPLGVSIYARAVQLIRQADRKYSNINWEYDAKQAAVHIAASLLKYDKANDKYEYPGGEERLYRTLEYTMGATDKPLLDVYSPEIRADDLKSGYQDQLRMIEFVCGLAYGTISDPQNTDKTATEVRSSKQRLYATVTDIQKALQTALTDLAEAISFWLNSGRTGDISITFNWDDSIMVDSDALAKQALLELQAGVIDNIEYYKRVYGMSEEAAKKLAADIAARSPAPENADFFSDGDNPTSGGEGGAA